MLANKTRQEEMEKTDDTANKKVEVNKENKSNQPMEKNNESSESSTCTLSIELCFCFELKYCTRNLIKNQSSIQCQTDICSSRKKVGNQQVMNQSLYGVITNKIGDNASDSESRAVEKGFNSMLLT